MLENDTLSGQNNIVKGGTRLKSKIEKTGTLGKPLVSIITTSLNRQKSIERAIISALNQTYTNIEYIIIDGYSTDDTIDVIKAYENKIDYWISEKDDGPTEAFNKGIIASR